ncbi:MAG: anaerobic ribonucleoside-triphosphate reductase activating protein [Eubacteriales bacterium]|nr:anaerobic ribonucleoside-triphosphate reductase activating protein [Eubacteriales bacterium]
MNYANIKPFSTENGTGVRVSLFVSGCPFHCEGCFNEEAWNYDCGKPFTEAVMDEIMDLLRPGYIAGLTLLGGEPAVKPHQKALLPLLQRIRKELPEKTIWVYTGYVYEDFLPGGDACDPAVTADFLQCCDVMVDGRFELSKHDVSLVFRGSSNQRVIDLNKTRELGRVTQLEI